MNCREAQNLIFAERDSAPDDTRRAALVGHLADCETCRRVREGLAGTLEQWRAETSAVAVPDAEREWQSVRRVIRQEADKPARSNLTWFGLPLAAAAAVAAGLYFTPSSSVTDATLRAQPATVASSAAANAADESTMVYVDDKSGWTFVWTADAKPDSRHI